VLPTTTVAVVSALEWLLSLNHEITASFAVVGRKTCRLNEDR